MPVYALFIEFSTGYVKVMTFPTLFHRALYMISLAEQPVTLRIKDYVNHAA